MESDLPCPAAYFLPDCLSPAAYRRLTLQDYCLDAIFGLVDDGSSWASKGKNVEGGPNIYTDIWVLLLSVVDLLRTWHVGRTWFCLLAFHQGGSSDISHKSKYKFEAS